MTKGRGEETTHSDHLSSERKGIMVTNTFSLRKNLSNKTSFVAFNGTIKIMLKFVHPLTSNRNFALGGLVVKVQVRLACKAPSSLSMTRCQLRSFTASAKKDG